MWAKRLGAELIGIPALAALSESAPGGTGSTNSGHMCVACAGLAAFAGLDVK